LYPKTALSRADFRTEIKIFLAFSETYPIFLYEVSAFFKIDWMRFSDNSSEFSNKNAAERTKKCGK